MEEIIIEAKSWWFKLLVALGASNRILMIAQHFFVMVMFVTFKAIA
jgi:hypothetical protein